MGCGGARDSIAEMSDGEVITERNQLRCLHGYCCYERDSGDYDQW